MNLEKITIHRHIHGDTIAGVIFLVVTTVYFSQTLELPLPFSRGRAGPAFYPMLLSGVMYICSLTLIYRGLTATNIDEIEIDLQRFVRPVSFTVITIVYAITLIGIGYLITTVVYTFLVTLLFEYGERQRTRLLAFSALVAVCVTGLGYLFFEIIFNVRLPGGIL